MKKYFILFSLILSTTLFAQQWTSVTTGMSFDVWGIDYLDANTVWVTGTTASSTTTQVAKSTDGGNTWTLCTAVPQGGGYGLAVLSATNAVIATGPPSGDGRIYRTTDGGTTWTQVYTTSGAWFNFADNLSATELWAQSDPIGGFFHIVKSTDGGATWSLATNPPAPSAGAAGANNCYYRIGNTLWFGESTANKVWKSTNGYNGPWTSGTATVNNVGTIAFSSASGPGVAGFWTITTSVNRTTDGGATWTNQNTTIGNVHGLEYVHGTNYVWAATTTGIFQSSDNGATWVANTRPASVTAVMNSVRFYGDANIGLCGGVGGVLLKSTLPPVVPVELTSFVASVIDGNVNLNWTTASEINNKGFEVERSINNVDFGVVGYVNGNGTTTEIKNYSFTDRGLAQGNYYYRLRQIDFNGQSEYSNVVAVEISSPVEFSLNQNYPNPFNPSTVINYSLAEAGNVKMAVYNLLGQEVANLMNGYMEAGKHTLSFDASNLPSGTYIYKIETAQFSAVRKMMLTK
jgi:photosystem II stability/assembly factor-like uncharacterized protein